MSKDGRMTLTEFLLARIAEDEADLTQESDPLADGVLSGAIGWIDSEMGDRHIATTAARVRAECAAKRRIIDIHGDGGGCVTCTDGDYLGLVDDWPCDTLRLLASPYADHPEFDQSWAVEEPSWNRRLVPVDDPKAEVTVDTFDGTGSHTIEVFEDKGHPCPNCGEPCQWVASLPYWGEQVNRYFCGPCAPPPLHRMPGLADQIEPKS